VPHSSRGSPAKHRDTGTQSPLSPGRRELREAQAAGSPWGDPEGVQGKAALAFGEDTAPPRPSEVLQGVCVCVSMCSCMCIHVCTRVCGCL
jgi:hypothetical protein